MGRMEDPLTGKLLRPYWIHCDRSCARTPESMLDMCFAAKLLASASQRASLAGYMPSRTAIMEDEERDAQERAKSYTEPPSIEVCSSRRKSRSLS